MSDTASAKAGAAPAMPVISVRPVTLAAPGRGHDLQVRVSAPTTGRGLPVVVFSHGMTLSMDSYAPLADFWAARGFVVIQPTHLDSLGLAPDDPRVPLFWRIRTEDLTGILDQLDAIEAEVPGLAGRVDHDRIAAAGHSWGAQTASGIQCDHDTRATDESPDRVAVIRHASLAYLRTALGLDDGAWPAARAALAATSDPLGRIDSK
jgi:predicted dienelactone hydrolase